MFCQKCGKELADGAKFCGICGNQVMPESVTSSPVQTAVNAPVPPTVSAPSAKTKSLRIALGAAAGIIIVVVIIMRIIFQPPKMLNGIWAWADAENEFSIQLLISGGKYCLLGVYSEGIFKDNGTVSQKKTSGMLVSAGLSKPVDFIFTDEKLSLAFFNSGEMLPFKQIAGAVKTQNSTINGAWEWDENEGKLVWLLISGDIFSLIAVSYGEDYGEIDVEITGTLERSGNRTVLRLKAEDSDFEEIDGALLTVDGNILSLDVLDVDGNEVKFNRIW